MSHVAPAVAVILGDRVRRENNELRQETMAKRDALEGVIRATGPNGVYPTHALGYWKDSVVSAFFENSKSVWI